MATQVFARHLDIASATIHIVQETILRDLKVGKLNLSAFNHGFEASLKLTSPLQLFCSDTIVFLLFTLIPIFLFDHF